MWPCVSNIRNAESQSGVHSAVLEGTTITIHGPNRESVDTCRAMLEMVREEVPPHSNVRVFAVVGLQM